MQSRDGITYMTVPETEIDIERFTHVHSEGNLVFGKYKGINTVVDRRKQVFCHFATCRTFSCYGNDDYVYHRWGCVEKEEQYVFYDHRHHVNGPVAKKLTYPIGTCFKVSHLGFYIQIYAQFPTYGYFGTEMSNTVKTSDKHQQVSLPTGYKPINDPEINTDKFKLTTIVNDMVFGIYNNEHVSIDRHYAVFCMFVDVSVIAVYKVSCAVGKWQTVKQTGDIAVTVDQSHWLFSKSNGSVDLVKGSVVKFDRKESGTGFIMKIQVPNTGLTYFGTELFNKIEPVKEKLVTKEQTNSPSFTLSDMLTQSNIGDVVGVYGPNETTVFVKATVASASYICDVKGNKWVLLNRNLKPVNRNESNIKPKERILSKEEAIQADKESTSLLGTNPFDSLLDLANVMSAESLFKRICKQVGLEYPDVPTEAFIRKAFDLLPDIYVYPIPSHFTEEANITFVNGDKYSIFSSPKTGMIYKEFKQAKQETKPTEQKTNKMITPDKQDYFKAVLKADEQFSIYSNAKYSKFDYEKGLLLNSKLIKDETFKEYNEPVEPFSISISPFDKLITYVPVISPVWYNQFARAGFFNPDDTESFVNVDANGNPWFIVETPKVVKPIEKEPVVISHVLNTVDDLCNNTIPAKFCLITDTKQVYQMLSELEYKQYRQSQFAKGNPVVESIIDKADQIWVKISM